MNHNDCDKATSDYREGAIHTVEREAAAREQQNAATPAARSQNAIYSMLHGRIAHYRREASTLLIRAEKLEILSLQLPRLGQQAQEALVSLIGSSTL